MSTKRPGLTAVSGLPPAVQQAVSGMRERLELLAGERGTKLDLLPTTATLADVIAAHNRLVTLLQR